jgi:osmotically-inducible protein OsmY
MRIVLLVALAVSAAAAAGCNPYVAAVSAVSATYGVATDVRSASTQASDTDIEAQIKSALLTDPVSGTGELTVFCRLGVVVLTGVVPPGSSAGREAVRIARETPGVVRVETFFVPYQPSSIDDFEIKEKIKAAFVSDPDVVAGRVDVAVYGGHVVLVGVVTSWRKADDFIADAQAVNGVVSVRSYIQVA